MNTTKINTGVNSLTTLKGQASRQRKEVESPKPTTPDTMNATETATVITVSVTDNGTKCEYTDNGKVLAVITYSKEFDTYDVNTPAVGYMTADVAEAHKACESGISWLFEQSGRHIAFDYSQVEEYNAKHYDTANA